MTIPSGLVSLRHACVAVAGARVTLRDPGSKNGTLVAGRQAVGAVDLADGDEIRVGPARLVFCAAGTGSTRTRR